VNNSSCRDDQRSSCIVDEHAVRLVDENEVVPALHNRLVGRPGVSGILTQPVPQEIEAQLFRRSVGDVAGVVRAALVGRLRILNATDGKAPHFIGGTHRIGVALGQIVVDGDDVAAAPH
jgi:hypothetical protein